MMTLLQNGQVLVRKGLWCVFKDKLRGIGETRVNDGTNTFRVYVWLGCEPALYILDAGMKKSSTGSEIPQWQQDRLMDRRERAVRNCAENADLERAFADRAARREQRGQGVGR